MIDYELIIQNGKTLYAPPVEGEMTWTTDRVGTPGQLTFSLVNSSELHIEEGNAVRLSVDGKALFFGFIFVIEGDKSGRLKITAYDQLRYLKNKDTYVIKKKTASQIIKSIAKDFRLNIGHIANTKYKIPARIEDNATLYDIINNALNATLTNTGELYVLYDEAGKLTLKSQKQMMTDYLIYDGAGENFSYKSDINDTYNQVKLVSDNKGKKRGIYISKSSKDINKWGVLQLYDTVKKGENGKMKADALLSLGNKPKKTLSISKLLGSTKVRAGSIVGIDLELPDGRLSTTMIVEKCTHKFSSGSHFMDLVLRGGKFSV